MKIQESQVEICIFRFFLRRGSKRRLKTVCWNKKTKNLNPFYLLQWHFEKLNIIWVLVHVGTFQTDLFFFLFSLLGQVFQICDKEQWRISCVYMLKKNKYQDYIAKNKWKKFPYINSNIEREVLKPWYPNFISCVILKRFPFIWSKRRFEH